MALTRDRMVQTILQPTKRRLPVAADVQFYSGSLAVLNGGFVEPGFVGTGLVAVGVTKERVDNRGGGDGAAHINVEAGTFCFESAGGADAIGIEHIGTTAYIVDDLTVARTNGTGTRSPAGRIWNVDASGVWVTIS